MYNFFSERFYKLRKECNYTQYKLGKLLNISRSTISKYENNLKPPDGMTIRKISEKFGAERKPSEAIIVEKCLKIDFFKADVAFAIVPCSFHYSYPPTKWLFSLPDGLLSFLWKVIPAGVTGKSFLRQWYSLPR